VAVPVVGVRLLAAFLLGACLLGCTSRACHLVGYVPDGGTTVGFDLRQVLANVPGPVVVWACLDENCVRHIGSSYRWTYFEDTNAALTDPETVDVRLVVRDRGRVVFDHATRLVQLDEEQPNGPGCDPTFFNADVLATPEGDLIQQ
jgi:hypothetical protein